MTRPEQSKPLGTAPAQTYGAPRYCIAMPTTPPYWRRRRGAARAARRVGGDADRRVRVDRGLLRDLRRGDPRAARRVRAAPAAPARAACMRAISSLIDESRRWRCAELRLDRLLLGRALRDDLLLRGLRLGEQPRVRLRRLAEVPAPA